MNAVYPVLILISGIDKRRKKIGCIIRVPATARSHLDKSQLYIWHNFRNKKSGIALTPNI